jgi:hypothetical protein
LLAGGLSQSESKHAQEMVVCSKQKAGILIPFEHDVGAVLDLRPV